MSLRHTLALLLSTAFCAYALIFSASTPGLYTIETAAPGYFGTLASGAPAAEDVAGMVALRQQASQALAQLQSRAAGNR
jgi:hypothetical protein